MSPLQTASREPGEGGNGNGAGLSPRGRLIVELIARRVVELLREQDTSSPLRRPTTGLVDAATLAKRLGVSRSTVYEHAAELGAIEVGSGDRPRLRFDPDEGQEAWTRRSEGRRSQEPQTPASNGRTRHRQPPRLGSEADLLPIHDRLAAFEARSRPRGKRPATSATEGR